MSLEHKKNVGSLPLETALKQHYQKLQQEEPSHALMNRLYDNIARQQFIQDEDRFRPRQHKPSLMQTLRQHYFIELSTAAAGVMIFFMMQLPTSTDPNTKRVPSSPNMIAKLTPPARPAPKKRLPFKIGAAHQPKNLKQNPPTTPRRRTLPRKAKAINRQLPPERDNPSHTGRRREYKAKTLQPSGLQGFTFPKQSSVESTKRNSHQPDLELQRVIIEPIDTEAKRQSLRKFHNKHLISKIKMCIEYAQLKNPMLQGKLTITWRVGTSQKSEKFSFEENSTGDRPLERCIQNSVRRLLYPKSLTLLSTRLSFLAVSNRSNTPPLP